MSLEFDDDDASRVMAFTFPIFTLHTGYGWIECGLCGKKNQVNILIRNAMTVLFSGFVFWCVGFAIVYGYVMFIIRLPDQSDFSQSQTGYNIF